MLGDGTYSVKLAAHLVKALPENLLKVLRLGELEQYAGGRLRQAEAPPEVELVANVGGLV